MIKHFLAQTLFKLIFQRQSKCKLPGIGDRVKFMVENRLIAGEVDGYTFTWEQNSRTQYTDAAVNIRDEPRHRWTISSMKIWPVDRVAVYITLPPEVEGRGKLSIWTDDRVGPNLVRTFSERECEPGEMLATIAHAVRGINDDQCVYVARIGNSDRRAIWTGKKDQSVTFLQPCRWEEEWERHRLSLENG